MLNLKGEVAGIQFNVVTSDKGGHSPDAVAELCVNRLISISEKAPQRSECKRKHIASIC
jgi:hypothetical protein